MPNINLEIIDPRQALVSVVASIALQEAAVSHVLNAEGEKIQAVVNMDAVTVVELQGINTSVGGTLDSVALLEDALQDKLRTALQALYPTATFTIYFVDDAGDPVNCQCVLCMLTNLGTGEETTLHATGDGLALVSLKPGSYTLQMIEACAGFLVNPTLFTIEVEDNGDVLFAGNPVDEEHPAEIELEEDPFFMASLPIAMETYAEPSIEPEPHAESFVEPYTEPYTEPFAEPYVEPNTEPNAAPYAEPHTDPYTEPDVIAQVEAYSALQPGIYAVNGNVFEVDASGNVSFRCAVPTDVSPAAQEPKTTPDTGYRTLRFKRPSRPE